MKIENEHQSFDALIHSRYKFFSKNLGTNLKIT